MKNRKFSSLSVMSAFTLAEVLITLGIIGVVAAITIPTLMTKTQDKELHTAWKKAYSELSQAQQQLLQDYSGDYYDQCDSSDDKCLRDLFLTKVKAIKICDNSTGDGCEAQSKFLDGQTVYFTGLNWNWPSFITPSGYSVCFKFPQKDCSGYPWISCGYLQVDVNGLKKPNTVGKDIYLINIASKDKFVPFTNPCDTVRPSCSDQKTTDEIDQDCLKGTGTACSAKYLYE